MVASRTLSTRIANGLIYLIVGGVALLSLLPLLNAVAISLSSSAAASAEKVYFWPVDGTLASYQQILRDTAFFQAFTVSVVRVLVGGVVSFVLSVLMAYPLSRDPAAFPARRYYMWFVVFMFVFPPTLIPFYLTVNALHLLNTIWALTVPVFIFQLFNVIILMNFFRGLPRELEEAARIDGAGPWHILWRIFVPISIPALATITLFTAVFHWNDWFWGAVFEGNPQNWPLQTYIQSLNFVQLNGTALAGLDPKVLAELQKVSGLTFTDAKIIVAIIPLLIVYPFLQRYFVKGLVLGSVKE